MKKFNFLKISKTKKLRYMVNYYEKKLFIIFLPGFMSDIEGKKPQTFKKFATKNKLGFLALEYLGHGKSSGEFIKGKFEDTLPVFFSKNRPIASVMNFDADLYSSTICALNYSKNVMDKNTILIFDELLMNESWEHDEFKALNEFCSANNLSYQVIAISFYTKQVAVKLIGL